MYQSFLKVGSKVGGDASRAGADGLTPPDVLCVSVALPLLSGRPDRRWQAAPADVGHETDPNVASSSQGTDIQDRVSEGGFGVIPVWLLWMLGWTF